MDNLIPDLSAFLTPLPCFADEPSRRALLIHAGLSDLLPSANLSGTAYQCVASILHDFEQYGRTDALLQLLREIRKIVGGEKRAECDALISRLRGAERQSAQSRRIRGDVRRMMIAGAIVVVLIAGYYVIVSFRPAPLPVEPATPTPFVQNGVTIEGDQNTVIGTNTGTIHVNSGVQPELFAEYVKKLALTENVVQQFFKILEEEQVPRDKWEQKLQEIAAQYTELLQRLEVIQSEDAEVVRLKTEARQAIEDGKFDDAETLLNQAETRDVDAIEQLEAVANKRRLSAAETNADNARLQEIRLRYAKAADYWREAANLLPKSEQQTRAEYLNEAGYDFHRVARYADALPLWEQSLAIRREIGDKAGEGMTLNNISQIYKARGDYATALTYLEQCLTIFREIGDKAHEGGTLNNISQIYDALDDYATALTYLDQSLAIQRETGDKAGEGTTLNNIGQIYDAQGDNATALTYLKQSLAIAKEIGNKAGEGTTLNNIGQIYKTRGDYAMALTYLEQSLSISREVGNKAMEVVTCWNIGLIYQKQGDLAKAEEYIRRTVQIDEEIGHPDSEQDRAELERIRKALQEQGASGGE